MADKILAVVRAERATVYLGTIPVEVFQLPDGTYRLSQTQVAETVENKELSIRQFLKSKAPEAIQFKDFTPVKFPIEGTKTRMNGIPIELAVAYWIKESRTGNQKALNLVIACASESIERRADRAFNQTRTEKEYQERLEARSEGKVIRRELTNAVDTYKENHPELSHNDKHWMFSNTSEQVNLALFGRKAKKLAEDLRANPDKLRDYLTAEEIRLITQIEDLAVRLIDQQDIHPIQAVKEAAARLLIPKIDRTF